MRDDFSVKLNKYRTFPRLFSLLYGFLLYKVSFWFMSLGSPGIEQAGFASTMVATSAAMFRFYVNSGPGSKEVKDAE